jgi:hypothetical protein
MRFLPFMILGTALGICPQLLAADAEAKGTFTGNSDPAKLAFVFAQKGHHPGGQGNGHLRFHREGSLQADLGSRPHFSGERALGSDNGKVSSR